jgi:hypothetical protein
VGEPAVLGARAEEDSTGRRRLSSFALALFDAFAADGFADLVSRLFDIGLHLLESME